MNKDAERLIYLLDFIDEVNKRVQDKIKELDNKEYTGYSHNVNTMLFKVRLYALDFIHKDLYELENDIRAELKLVNNSNDITEKLETDK